MNWKTLNIKTRLHILASSTLLFGLGSSLMIYMIELHTQDDEMEYTIDVTKKSLRDMEVIGGKANVLASELIDWFNGLWHGRTLAYTVAFITIAISVGLLIVAYYSSNDFDYDS